MNNYFLKLTFFFVLLFTMNTSSVTAQNTGYTFALVHGSWHGDWAWYLLESRLKRFGHEVININLPGHGVDPLPEEDTIILNDYVETVISAINQSEEPVILVGHSFGGTVISEVAERVPHKIDKLVYLAAFLLKDGQTTLDISAIDTASLLSAELIFDPEKFAFDLKRDNLTDVFYEGAPKESILLSNLLITPEPAKPIQEAVNLTTGRFGLIDRYYISTLRDRAISPAVQKMMYTNTPCNEVYAIRSGHSPFFSHVATLKNILLRIARDRDRTIQAGQRINSKENRVAKIDKKQAWVLDAKVYPNPNRGILRVAINRQVPYSIAVQNPDGITFVQKSYSKNQPIATLNLNDYESGIYLVTVSSKGQQVSKKVLIE